MVIAVSQLYKTNSKIQRKTYGVATCYHDVDGFVSQYRKICLAKRSSIGPKFPKDLLTVRVLHQMI